MLYMLKKINRNTVFYFLVGISVFLFSLLALIPASFITKFIPSSLPLNVSQPSGTLWSGEFSRASVKQVDIGKVKWDLSVLPLLWGSANLQLHTQKSTGSLNTAVGLASDSIQLDDTKLEFLIADLMPLFYGFPVSVDGDLVADLSQVIIHPGKKFIIEGRAEITDLQLIAPASVSLGKLVIRFEAEKKGTRINIKDEQGPVAIDVVINIKESGQYTSKSTFIPQPSADAAIKNSLSLLGRADNQGRYSINYNGRLALKF